LILHYNNAPAHYALRVREFLAKKSSTKMDPSPYSPGLDPFESWLFPKLKDSLKGQRFADIPDVQRKVATLVRGIPEDYFRQCHHHLTKCMCSQGEYFEGDSTNG
jgi:hypothetical protein